MAQGDEDDEERPDRTLRAARYQGKIVRTIPRTMTLKMGELKSVAKAVSTRAPPFSIP